MNTKSPQHNSAQNPMIAYVCCPYLHNIAPPPPPPYPIAHMSNQLQFYFCQFSRSAA